MGSRRQVDYNRDSPRNLLLPMLSVFSDQISPSDEVNVLNSDFEIAEGPDGLSLFIAEYRMGMSESIDCLHCLLERQLDHSDEALGWLSAPVMASYVTVGEREDGMALQYDEAVCVFEHCGVPHLARISIVEPSWLQHTEGAILRMSVFRSEEEGEHQALFDRVTQEVHDLMAATLYWHGTMDLEEEAIRENNQVAVDALRNVVSDLVAEFNEQLPEGMAASINHGEEGDDDDFPAERILH